MYKEKVELNEQKEYLMKQLDECDKALDAIYSSLNLTIPKRDTYTYPIKASINKIFVLTSYPTAILQTLRELETNIKQCIANKKDEEIFKLKLDEKTIDFLKKICPKEFNELVKTIQTYKTDNELNEALKTLQPYKSDSDQTTQKKDTYKHFIKIYINKIVLLAEHYFNQRSNLENINQYIDECTR